ncbi:DUF4386 domain-containing protein [Dyella flagellata]|uniref:DUF4386 domain-containing protein n=1 Tax=Dyella flagellata TaxID=1867833 RepID=A0ABQ5XBU2_9GAMM|nr:DUF4386 domain-containing protein [Dyella flagellata]GLQ88767.1 hypothetical protein GCM10007898_23370 [Dyella flagellata]
MNGKQARRLAAIAGVLITISIFAGGFAEVYVPGKLLVASDPMATARNVAASAQLFRLSFLVYLIEALCDVTLTLIFYMLLRPVSQALSLLAAFFGLVSTATFATSELFYFMASVPVLDQAVQRQLSSDESALFIYSALTLYGYGGTIFMVFYGVAMAIKGHLFYRSAYFPKWLGALLLLAGASFIVKNVIAVALPQYDSDLLLAPTFVTMIALAVVLLFKSDYSRWNQ